ncbi:hypothetical protein [Blattabacterium cuenoti]|uniref:hypothetical protein n=1 Tax=Blattabacterium cuenoti TaxID=1653831 RepID=UPI00311F48C2
MKNLNKKFFFIVLFLFCVFHNCFSYSSSLEKLSGISVVVGNDIILDSEIKNRNENKSFCNTDVVNNILTQKLMLYYAKKDKNIKISEQELELKIQEFLLEMKKKKYKP